jgi:N-formylglutamate deformylase
MNEVFSLTRGYAPLLISIPHLGSEIPESLRANYTDVALTVADTDWHLDRLYSFASKLDATVLLAKVSRYVIDLNRPPSDESLYPGQTTTGLCPDQTFRGEPVYQEGRRPDVHERNRRLNTYWRSYHQAIEDEVSRLRRRHANVLLWEAHSIASILPRLFDGKLPDLNFGTRDGNTASNAILRSVIEVADNSGFTWVANGRFKGGYITRRFGAPNGGIHALQLEMCQSTYMNESYPFEFRPDIAARLQPSLESMVREALAVTCRLGN